MKKNIFIIFIPFVISISIFLEAGVLLLPPEDPAYIYYRNAMRSSHTVNFFRNDYPYAWSDITVQLKPLSYSFSNFAQVENNQGYLRLFPSLQMLDTGVRFDIVGTAGAKITPKIAYIMSIKLLPENIGEEILGTEHSRFGYTGRIVTGGLRYKGKNISVNFGRFPVRWGQSWSNSVILSGNAPTFDHLQYSINVGKFKISTLIAQLGSAENLGAERIKRFLSGHQIQYFSKNEKWIFAFGDGIIYTGKNRSLEMHYLNPIIPMLMADFEGENEGPDYGENDNSILFTHGRYILRSNFSIYYELLVDEFQVDSQDRKIYKDALAVKVGLDGSFGLFSKPSYFELEYTRIDNWTYTHHGEFTNIMSKGIPLGYYLGPDVESIWLKYDIYFNPRIIVGIENTYYVKGAITINSDWDNIGHVDWATPSEPVTYHNIFSLSLSYHFQKMLVWCEYNGDLLESGNETLIFGITKMFSTKFNL